MRNFWVFTRLFLSWVFQKKGYSKKVIFNFLLANISQTWKSNLKVDLIFLKVSLSSDTRSNHLLQLHQSKVDQELSKVTWVSSELLRRYQLCFRFQYLLASLPDSSSYIETSMILEVSMIIKLTLIIVSVELPYVANYHLSCGLHLLRMVSARSTLNRLISIWHSSIGACCLSVCCLCYGIWLVGDVDRLMS